MSIISDQMPKYGRTALVLQGGGALGSYQAGVYEGLHEAGIVPNWLSGISIGAFNTALIAGNPAHLRVKRLKEFWEYICQPNSLFALFPKVEESIYQINDYTKRFLGFNHGLVALFDGQNGFFSPRIPPSNWFEDGNPEQTSFYTTSVLKKTLEQFCDFELINDSSACGMRVSVGAVNVRTGNFEYFDNTQTELTPEHFMASGALPPGFPPIKIGDQYYWDGGVVSNTPLYYAFKTDNLEDTLVFQVDLWNAKGKVPKNMPEVFDRMKEIRFSSRTRTVTNDWKYIQELRYTLGRVLEKANPEQIAEHKELYEHALKISNISRYNLIHLIYEHQDYESQNKDFQFGLAAMRDHWSRGLVDIQNTLMQPHYLDKPDNEWGLITRDVHREQK